MTWKGADWIYSGSCKMQLQNRIENMVLILPEGRTEEDMRVKRKGQKDNE